MTNYELDEQEVAIISYALGLMYEFKIESDAGISSKKMQHFATKDDIERLAKKFGVEEVK
jgi:hypothetical protein